MTREKGRVADFRPEIRALSAYHVADASGLIKLDAMENPYTWPDSLRREWLSACAFSRQPLSDPRARKLAASMRRPFQFPEDCALLLGNGSDEIIQMLALAVTVDSVILSVEPGFVMYRQISPCVWHGYVGVPLREDDFPLDMPALLQAIREHQPPLVFSLFPTIPRATCSEARTCWRC